MYQPAFPQYAQPYGTAQYQQPMMPAQQPQAMPQQRGISGRMVSALSEIVPNEVPMDGSVAFFPTADGSAIFAKAWNPNGTISTVQYSPLRDDKPEASAGPTLADVLSRLDDIESLIGGTTQAQPKQARRTARKAAEYASE